jgi:hypothetical protein
VVMVHAGTVLLRIKGVMFSESTSAGTTLVVSRRQPDTKESVQPMSASRGCALYRVFN